MGPFRKKSSDEQTVIVQDSKLDETEARLQKRGYAVCGEKSVSRQRTQIWYRPNPDNKAR
jgi:hypothetical protein